MALLNFEAVFRFSSKRFPDIRHHGLALQRCLDELPSPHVWFGQDPWYPTKGHDPAHEASTECHPFARVAPHLYYFAAGLAIATPVAMK
jgi:hypothetical protein